jgi:hypothetical protein
MDKGDRQIMKGDQDVRGVVGLCHIKPVGLLLERGGWSFPSLSQRESSSQQQCTSSGCILTDLTSFHVS